MIHHFSTDWIEDEMCDDQDFLKDVLEQRIKAVIKEEVKQGRLQTWPFVGMHV